MAIEYLDGDGSTVVREIATEKSQAMYLWATSSGYEAGQFSLSDNAVSDLWVVFGDRRPPKILHAPIACPVATHRWRGAGVAARARLRVFGGLSGCFFDGSPSLLTRICR